uniref:Small ribosomal subunit protein eS6 n=1 Tax=Staphylothermus marinus TaxID=2280 RepID=A0A7J3KGB7_STAMA
MPDFKIVVSDPQAYREMKIVKVKVVGDSSVDYNDKMKDGFELPLIKANEKLLNELKPVHGVVTIRMVKPGTTDKVKITGRLIVDNNIQDGEAHVNYELLVNKTGVSELEGYIFRSPSWQIRVNDERTRSLIGLKIGDVFDGSVIGLKNVKLRICGGSDNSGLPMRPDLPGGVKVRLLLSGPPGFHPTRRGERRKKTVRGNTITVDMVQINTRIIY